MRTCNLFPWLAVGAILSSLSAAEYSLVDLGPGTANGINNQGAVVGHDNQGGFLYDSGGRHPTVVRARLLGETTSYPWEPGVAVAYALDRLEWNGINDAGRLVGSAILSNKFNAGMPANFRYPIVWDGTGDGVAVDLAGASALAVNGVGSVVGGGPGGAFRLDGTNVTGLWTVGLDTATDINNQGVIAGSSQGKPALMSNGNMTLLNVGPSGNYSGARAINSAGQVVGGRSHCSIFSCFNWGFFWSDQTTILLPPDDLLNGGIPDADASDINDSGVVIGRSKIAGKFHAFIYRDGHMSDLNSLIPTAGWELTEARAINENGQIVGMGLLNGEARAFLLNPLNPGEPTPPSLVQQPVGGRFGLAETVTLTFTANGTGPLQYQWQRNQVDLAGETNNVLTLTGVDAGKSGAYRAVVSNVAGEAFSAQVVVEVLDPVIGVARYVGIAVRGAVGGLYQIQWVAPANATDWKPLDTLTLTNSPQLWFDLESGTNASHRFYRAVRVLP